MCQNVSKIDYSKGLIYKLCCKDPTIEDIYIGSTTNLIQRKKTHKSRTKNEINKCYNLTVYKFIREHGGFENWDIIVIQYYSCNSKKNLETKEREYIEKLKPTLNIRVPCRTQKEYMKTYNSYYKNKNRLQINKNLREKIECEYCKTITNSGNLKRHQQSLKCKKFQLQEDNK
tara:strand:- start:425 stop:943 length:519 start_codon:yes stop_codon:yes gene_type:complete